MKATFQIALVGEVEEDTQVLIQQKLGYFMDDLSRAAVVNKLDINATSCNNTLQKPDPEPTQKWRPPTDHGAQDLQENPTSLRGSDQSKY